MTWQRKVGKSIPIIENDVLIGSIDLIILYPEFNCYLQDACDVINYTKNDLIDKGISGEFNVIVEWRNSVCIETKTFQINQKTISKYDITLDLLIHTMDHCGIQIKKINFRYKMSQDFCLMPDKFTHEHIEQLTNKIKHLKQENEKLVHEVKNLKEVVNKNEHKKEKVLQLLKECYE
jgi:hypothetical protein